MTALKLKPRHKWFANMSKDSEDADWMGPYSHLEDAAFEELKYSERGGNIVYVAQGYRMTKAEREEKGVEYTWEVDSSQAIEIRLPLNRGKDK